MSDTENTFDFSLYKNYLKKMEKDLTDAINVQLESYDNSGTVDWTKIKEILEKVDKRAVNSLLIINEISKDEDTCKKVRDVIEDSMKDIGNIIAGFAEELSDKKLKREANKYLKDNIKNGKTHRFFEEVTELHKEKGKYERDKLEDRIDKAKKERKTAKKMLDQRKDYDDAIEEYKKNNTVDVLDTQGNVVSTQAPSDEDARNALDKEFEELKTVNESWRDKKQKLERIGEYKYEKELNDLIDFANDQKEVTEDLVKKFKKFRTEVRLFSEQAISTYFDGIKDFESTDIYEIRDILNSFDVSDLKEQPEIKNPKKELKKEQDKYTNLVNGGKLDNIFKAFPEIKEKILSGIEDGDTKKIDAILNDTRTMLKNFPKNNEVELWKTIARANDKLRIYEKENSNDGKDADSNASTERPEAPEDNITDELDLTDLILEGEELRSVEENKRVKIKIQPSKITGDSKDDFDDEKKEKYYDFSTSNEGNMDRVVNAAYEELCKKKIEHKEAINRLLPTISKKQPGHWWTKLLRNWRNKWLENKGEPTVEAKQTEKAIKEALKQKIEGRIAKGKENEQYAEDLLSFDERVALTKEDQSKFNQAVTKIIADHVKNNKGEINEGMAEQMKKKAEDKILER